MTVVRFKPEYKYPNKRVVDTRTFSIVKVKRRRITPGMLASISSISYTFAQSVMERYPWAIVEDFWQYFLDVVAWLFRPRSRVALSTGKTVAVSLRKPKKEPWVMLAAKKAQR